MEWNYPMHQYRLGSAEEAAFGEKEAPVDNELKMSKHWALETKANPIMGCIRKASLGK